MEGGEASISCCMRARESGEGAIGGGLHLGGLVDGGWAQAPVHLPPEPAVKESVHVSQSGRMRRSKIK
jgi:hypothetical protein